MSNGKWGTWRYADEDGRGEDWLLRHMDVKAIHAGFVLMHRGFEDRGQAVPDEAQQAVQQLGEQLAAREADE